jgi:DNA-binding response OmpR family regulator
VEQQHPILPEQSVERAPLRRPRFTATEVLILNELLNKSPDPVPVSSLVKLLRRYSGRLYLVYPSAVKQHVVNLRAKLGEASRQPTLIITLHVADEFGGTELAYQYRDPSP